MEVRFLSYAGTLQTAQGHITAEGLQVLAGNADSSVALAQALARGMKEVASAEVLWRKQAMLEPVAGPAVPDADRPRIATLAEVVRMPVVAVEVKARRGRKPAPGVMALAVDSDRLVAIGG